jgi:hypothetical protein
MQEQVPSTDQKEYELQLMRSLGADSIEEAMEIIQAAGIKAEDIPSLLVNNGLMNQPKMPLQEPPKLTRRQ